MKHADLKGLLVAAVLLAAGSASQTAGAKRDTPGQDRPLDTPEEGMVPGLRTAGDGACVKQCPNDMLPCDPPVYKQADGRCTTAWH